MTNRLWAVGGGKGGVGKSIVSLLVAESLAKRGANVLLVDADLGGSNLHTLLGLRHPRHTIGDFLERRVESLEDVVQQTDIPNLRFIAGADDILGIANPKFAQKTRLLTHIDRLAADVVLLDLGAGTSSTTLDFFLYASGRIVVVTPQVTSIQNAYGFIKASLYRKLSRAFSQDREALEMIERASDPVTGEPIGSIADLRRAFAPDLERAGRLSECLADLSIELVVNMVREPKDRECATLVKTVAEKYLDLTPEPFGVIDEDAEVDRSINRMSAFLKSGSRSAARLGAYDVAGRILKRASEVRTARPAVAPVAAR